MNPGSNTDERKTVGSHSVFGPAERITDEGFRSTPLEPENLASPSQRVSHNGHDRDQAPAAQQGIEREAAEDCRQHWVARLLRLCRKRTNLRCFETVSLGFQFFGRS